ncbi:MAG: acyl-CoA dehydratase activase [Candidatus Cloacimonetes bacterium]|jgi:predicted CoA-substrate-specific enzyme activase|nr:acyl-CoA dehydratase activase [Candidatus Cloacimonadota bacterium]MDD2506620.1 acyl-CoA dehydratase activase [Candidatus Cloacimonadota bacterium]MDD4147243.1 acyl-CoA dehydratase activase [Candidatus Cloacimonadota bacterium]MDD4560239.1 acyl-CoA dehydratase activase [Candidatus Cloacimonadota bacterium]
MNVLGVDIGSRNTKIVVYDSLLNKIAFSAYKATDVSASQTVDDLLVEMYRHLGHIHIDKSCVTGYGRKLYSAADMVKSEITCHAKACSYLFPHARTVIDIGGQDSKIISLNEDGSVKDFVMNDKCAAGTGRFLEMTAMRLMCDLDTLSQLASQSDETIALSSTCVVFAESEIIGLLAKGHKVANIARAVHVSIARRIYAQMAPLQCELPVVFTGGVAQGSDLAQCISNILYTKLLIPDDPEITGALGAALIAL